jgi:hypothetical protein
MEYIKTFEQFVHEQKDRHTILDAIEKDIKNGKLDKTNDDLPEEIEYYASKLKVKLTDVDQDWIMGMLGESVDESINTRTRAKIVSFLNTKGYEPGEDYTYSTGTFIAVDLETAQEMADDIGNKFKVAIYDDKITKDGGIPMMITESLNETNMNDPILVAIRAARQKREVEMLKPKNKRKPLYGKRREMAENDLWAISQDLKELYADRGQMLTDMEQEAEAEGGPIADKYGSELNKIENDIQKLITKRNKLEMMLAEGTVSDVNELINEGGISIPEQNIMSKIFRIMDNAIKDIEKEKLKLQRGDDAYRAVDSNLLHVMKKHKDIVKSNLNL